MFEYINPHSKYIAEYIELGGKELAYDVLKMIPDDYRNRITKLEEAIRKFDYPAIQMEVHTIKANFRQIVDVDNEFMRFIQQFEDASRTLAEKKEKNIPVDNNVDFSDYFSRFKQESDKVVKEIDNFSRTLAP
jgi:Mg2+ and Co2+ transporter CorA